MKKNYGLLAGCLVVAALGVIYAGVGAYQDHTKEKERQQAETEKIYMTDFSDIEAISYDNDGNVLAFTKDGDSWTYDGDDQFPVNTTRMDSLAGTVKKLPAVRRLEGGDDLAAYGLDTPLRRVTVSADDGKTVTILIGDKTDGGNYYAVIDGQNVPCLISSSLFDETAYGLEDMMALEEFPAVVGTDIQSITIEKNGVSEHYVKKKLAEETSPQSGSAESEDGTIAWYRGSDDTEDNKLPDNSALNVLADSLSGLVVKSCANYKVTDEELAGYGLDHPQAVLSYTYEKDGEDKTFSLSVGNPVEDGTTYYTRTEDSKYVNEIDKTALDQCMTADTGNDQ